MMILLFLTCKEDGLNWVCKYLKRESHIYFYLIINVSVSYVSPIYLFYLPIHLFIVFLN